MEDKTFEFMEKMYSEMTKGFDKVNIRLDGIDTRFDGINTRLDRIEITLEHDIKSNLQVLHEAVEGNTVKLDEHSSQLTDINNKLDYLALSVNSQDKRLEVVETFKRKNIK